MKLWKKTTLGLLAMTAVGAPLAQAAGFFTDNDYQRAGWLTTRFYGAQRSGAGPNWVLMQHPTYKTSFTTDADAGRDLSGGWFDCGDHVTFGQTFFYSAYVLARAYASFPEGFPDRYHGDYSDYAAKPTTNWDMADGSADGVPDLLQELKYATDWMIKATPNGTTFYYQKGDGKYDHKQWITAGKMSTLATTEGGSPRNMYKNPTDGSMSGFATATLALMSQLYRKYDAAYADTCLAHAKLAWTYTQANKGKAAGSTAQDGCRGNNGACYNASAAPWAPVVIGGGELFDAMNKLPSEATAAAAVKKEAISAYTQPNIAGNNYSRVVDGHGYAMDYLNPQDLAVYLGVTVLGQTKTVFLEKYVSTYVNSVDGSTKLCNKGNSSWGALRYPANIAFVVALYSKWQGITTYDDFIYNQIDYIMGSKTNSQSFIIGFGTSSPQHPHHRNIYLNDKNVDDAAKQKLTLTAKSKNFGYMVGGSWSPGTFVDDINQYTYSEGGIDYNAGLVGALGYINSKRTPVDTSKFSGGGSTGIATDAWKPSLRVTNTAAGFSVAMSGKHLVTGEAFDLSGRRVASLSTKGDALSWNVGGTAPGVYHVRVVTAEGQSMTRSVVVR